MKFGHLWPERAVIYYEDWLEAGVVKSRFSLRELILAKKIRRPHKNGNTRQATAYWYRADAIEDLERLYEAQQAAE